MKQKIFFFFALFLFILSFSQILFNLFQILPKKNFIDFFVYQGAVEKFLAGKNPYQFLYGQPPDKVPFNYPPSALVVLLPLNILPMKITQIILTIISLFFFWLTFLVILKLSKIKISLPHFLILLSFFTQTFPVKFTLVLGQINLIVLGVTYGGVYLYQKSCLAGRQTKIKNQNYISKIKNKKLIYQFFSILLFSLSSSLKIFPLFTLPLFFILKDYFFVFFVLTIFFALNLLPSVNLFNHYYFQIIPNLSKSVGIPNFYDQSLLAFLLRLGFNPLIAKIITWLFLLFFYLLIFKRSGIIFKKNPTLPVSFVFALFSIGGLFSWKHHLVFAYPLIFIFYLKIWQKIKKKPLVKKLLFHLPFFLLWLLFVFHFKNETDPLKNPLIASYQTIGVLFVLLSSFLIKP